ncbi:N-acyl homoserine lactonase family protein [Devosia rhodophyticola]|uniref:N-acyl homoserine lactonase family protein n=1 Tax=Devosia rhodophyticola TaxID=3026423 RepID=A0ABY7YT15_9HYPH|nr:N-acyl homoserine lactonase family protein [Devosia rhodophyticola]WDR04521.1 N-acyl homoserine lactonase family protein [Devosia rhodophyticola]
MADDQYEVFALKYAQRNGRTRADSFQFDDDHASPHDMDYFVWILRNGARTILVDTGYDTKEAARRGRPILSEPIDMLKRMDIAPTDITDLIVTHLHYDHAGSLDQFEHAQFHLQQAELGFAVSPCMCHSALRAPFTADHVCTAVKQLYAGKLTFHDGSGQIVPGVRVHRVGGHSSGLQIVEVDTANGPLVLASDASHYYENFEREKLFPIVVDPLAMLDGFKLLQTYRAKGAIVVPGHDPEVLKRFAPVHDDGMTVRLDQPL